MTLRMFKVQGFPVDVNIRSIYSREGFLVEPSGTTAPHLPDNFTTLYSCPTTPVQSVRWVFHPPLAACAPLGHGCALISPLPGTLLQVSVLPPQIGTSCIPPRMCSPSLPLVGISPLPATLLCSSSLRCPIRWSRPVPLPRMCSPCPDLSSDCSPLPATRGLLCSAQFSVLPPPVMTSCTPLRSHCLAVCAAPSDTLPR